MLDYPKRKLWVRLCYSRSRDQFCFRLLWRLPDVPLHKVRSRQKDLGRQLMRLKGKSRLQRRTGGIRMCGITRNEGSIGTPRRGREKPTAVAKEPDKPAPAVEAKPKDFHDIRDLEEFQKEIKRLREVAIFDPTPDHLHTYLQAQEYALNRSQVFADTARRVVWQNPDVDFTAKSPQANYALANQRSRAEARKYDVLSEISKTHGIVFFFKSDCPYCHDMAPVMQSMQSQYGIEVMPVSDGWSWNPGISATEERQRDFKIRVSRRGHFYSSCGVPGLKRQENGCPCGTGAMAMDEVAERIRVLMTTQVGNDY